MKCILIQPVIRFVEALTNCCNIFLRSGNWPIHKKKWMEVSQNTPAVIWNHRTSACFHTGVMSEQRSSSLVTTAVFGCIYSHLALSAVTLHSVLDWNCWLLCSHSSINPPLITSEMITTLHLNMSLQTRLFIHIFENNQISTGALVLDEASYGVNRATYFPYVVICYLNIISASSGYCYKCWWLLTSVKTHLPEHILWNLNDWSSR